MALWLLSVNIGPSCVQWLFCWLNIFLETQRISYLLKGWGETCVWDKIRRAVRHHYSHIWMAKIQNRQHQMLARLWSNRNSHSLPMGMQSITLEDSLAVFLQNWTLSNQTIQQSTQCSLVFMSTQKPTQGCYSSFVHKCQKPGNNHTVLGEWIHQFGYIRQWHIIQCWKKWALKPWKDMWSESESRSVVSDSLLPRGLYSSWNSPGQNTGVGHHSLLQEIFWTQGSNPRLLHCR